MNSSAFEILMKHNPSPMFIYDVETLRFLEVNQAALDLYGYSRSTFLQMDLTDLYSTEDIQTLLYVSDVKEGEFTGPWKHKKNNGEILLVEINLFRIDHQEKAAHLNFIQNVTRKNAAEKEIEILKRVLEASENLAFVINKNNEILYVSENVKNTLKLSKRELLNSSFLNLTKANYKQQLIAFLNNDKIFPSQGFIAELKNASGVYEKYKLSINIFRDKDDGVDKKIVTAKIDIPVKRQETSGSSEKFELDENFFANMFHEILTPINAILGFAQYLSESIEEPSEEQSESLSVISENRYRLLQTMDAVIEYLHIAQKDEKTVNETFFIKDAVEIIKPDVARGISGLNFKYYYDIPENFAMKGDYRKIQTFLSMLFIMLARLASTSAIFIAVKKEGDNAVIELKDSENSVSSEFKNNLYMLLSLPEADSGQRLGTSKLTIKLLKQFYSMLNSSADIPAENDTSNNSIKIRVPLKLPERKEISKPAAFKTVKEKESAFPKSGLKSAPAVVKEQSLSDLSCLYVEDQIDAQILFKSQMKELKQIDSSLSFEDSIPLLEKNHYDFILLDINLQGEYNGLDALRMIRQFKGYENVPIIAVTAYALPGDKEKFLRAGFSDFVSKPILRANLVNSLENLLLSPSKSF